MRAFVLLVAACGAASHTHTTGSAQRSADITLFRDAALVRERLAVTVGESRAARIELAKGVPADQISGVTVLDSGGLATVAVRQPIAPVGDEEDPAEPLGPDAVVTLDVTAPRAGEYTVDVAYVAAGLTWDAGYTVLTTAARDRAVIHGALGIHNTTEKTFGPATVRVIDTELTSARSRSAEQLAADLVGAAASTTPRAVPRDLGVHALTPGDTRIDLQPATGPRPMRAVLVYDPVGTSFDHPGSEPLVEHDLGLARSRSTAVTESVEIERDVAASAGLPAGPVRLLEQREDGTSIVLGDAKLFEAATRVATVDTIPIGTADGVTGHRRRIELTVDDEGTPKRVIEEFAIEIESSRPAPVDVLIREHLYRGLNWAVAYHSSEATQEGAQQMATRARVPAHGTAKIMYVVVYSSAR
jgi:hypothetical protein